VGAAAGWRARGGLAKITTATLTQQTANRKITRDPKSRPASITRAAQSSCPETCKLRGNGCYAEGGPSGIHSGKLNRAAEHTAASPIDIATAEAAAIVEGWPRDGRPLRLHEVGDCATNEAAQLVSAAVALAQSEGAGPAWTYTHAWADVGGGSWGSVSCLASVESTGEAIAASARGYPVAILAPTRNAGVDRLALAGLHGVYCPAQAGDSDCEACRLCTRGEALFRAGRGIIFTPHGKRARMISERLSNE